MRVLIAALLLAGTCLLQDTPRFSDPFIGKLEARLERLQGAAAEREIFVNVTVRVADLREELGAAYSPTIGGIHTEDGILLSSEFLNGLYGEIRSSAPHAGSDEVMEIAASQFLPLLAHELRHQIDTKKVGISSFGYKESELSARTVETAVISEARDLFAEDFKYETSLTRSQSQLVGLWQNEGPNGLRAFDQNTVAANYPSLSRGDDLLGLSQHIPQARRLKRLLHDHGSRAPPKNEAIAKMTRGALTTRREANRFIQQGEEIDSLLKRLGDVQWYYQERERQAWRAWQDENPNQTL
ncbi:MAG: hypothetical protein COB53_00355 [Elusimicrobia bacterium]|nr:MAG: hypothetical protein COB53_00355 [Elusimicrobiota bacterium]